MTTTNAASDLLRSRQLRTGMGWRIAVSIVSVIGPATFLLLSFTFLAAGFTWIQGTAVVVISILVSVAANGVAWASWGTRFVSPLPEAEGSPSPFHSRRHPRIEGVV